ncbi:MAG: TetR/AcrR family transcriptional regulator [Candidatus Krumholzibacteriia bacterium]
MAKARPDTRERILETAEGLILQNGYAATSVDRIIEAVGITKGAFFYHFKTKSDMARALVERNAALDLERLAAHAARARKLSPDPLQSLLVFLGLFIEEAEAAADANPGCLFASFCYESGQFEPEVLARIEQVIVAWRELLAAWLAEAAAAHPPVRPLDTASLADMLTVVYEGAFVVARTLRDARVFPDQLRHYRSYLELLFGA